MKKNTTIVLSLLMLFAANVNAASAEVSPVKTADVYQCVVSGNETCSSFSIKFNDKKNIMGIFLKDENTVIIFDLEAEKVILKHCPTEGVKDFEFNGNKVIVRYVSWVGSKKSFCSKCLKKKSTTKKKIDLNSLENERAASSAAILESVLTGNKDCTSFSVKFDKDNKFMAIFLEDINRVIVYDLRSESRIFDFIPYTTVGDINFEITQEKVEKEEKEDQDDRDQEDKEEDKKEEEKTVNKIIICYADSLKSKQKYDLESGECVSSKTFYDIFPASS